MKFNGIKIDIDRAIHEISMEYARRDLDLMIKQGRVTVDEETGCLNCMFDTYVSSVQYLSEHAANLIKMEEESD